MTWQSYSADAARLSGEDLFSCLGNGRTLELLKSLERFRGEHPGVAVVVESPSSWVAIGRNTTKGPQVRSLERFIEKLQDRTGIRV